jgi:hypothetical protein
MDIENDQIINSAEADAAVDYCKGVVYERPRPNRNINIILSNYICCIDCRIGLSTINYLVILDIHRCKIIKDYRKQIFKLGGGRGGGGLRKIAPGGGGRDIFLGDFAKTILFFPILGGGGAAGAPPLIIWSFSISIAVRL